MPYICLFYQNLVFKLKPFHEVKQLHIGFGEKICEFPDARAVLNKHDCFMNLHLSRIVFKF